ncbi:MAG: hypothetical protein KC776_02625 [Myxococcales bacterium]|nr:hypothetical protein [Myxococcales bacterium]MCB9581179.1 hypothetical protein [Polyangiaceae bacterium]
MKEPDLTPYSRAAFDALGVDTPAARAHADALAHAVILKLHCLLRAEVQRVADELNALGHDLRPEGDSQPGEYCYRDESPTGPCRLRLAFDITVSTGYAHLTEPES